MRRPRSPPSSESSPPLRPGRRPIAAAASQCCGHVGGRVLWLRRRPRPGGLFIALVVVPALLCPLPPHAAWALSARAMPLVRYRKVVILGYRSVGKTSLAHQFIDGEFLECYDPTVESTYNKMLMVGKDEFHLQLVDTAGQDEYTILPHSFSIGIHGYVLVYSVTSLRSFQVVKTLHNRLYESRGKTRMPVVLVGNKADLSMESREVNTDEGKKLADSWGAIFLESSAKENQMTRGIFTKIIEEIDRVDNSYGAERSCCLM